MSESAPKRMADGFTSVEAGIDTNTAPHLLPPNQLANGINITVRNAAPEQRPGYDKHTLSFYGDDAAVFASGLFQGAACYEADSGYNSIIASISGQIFRIVPEDGFKVQNITPKTQTTTTAGFIVPAVGSTVLISVANVSDMQPGLEIIVGNARYTIQSILALVVTAVNVNDTPTNVVPLGTSVIIYQRNPNNIFDCYMEQAENYLVIQDGLSRPIIFNGASCRRSNPDEIKSGTVMKYVQGRIWYATNGGFSFRATDLVRGPSGTAATKYRDSVLKETENTFLNEGGDFSVPANSGGIRAMAVPANLDTSLGQGPLQVFTKNTVFSVNTPIDRTIWKDVTYPIQTVSQISYGALGHRNTVAQNGDIFYRSTDGIRSFKLARQDFAQWRTTPISVEEILYLRGDMDMLLPYGSGVVFDNRLLMTCNPHYTSQGIYHLGLTSLDFNIVSGMRTKLPPVWEGVWTGLRVLQILKGNFGGRERCFLFTLSSVGDGIELWELTTDTLFDNDTNRIQWSFETREFDLQRDYERKRLEGCDIYVENLVDNVDFDLRYRPDSWPGWMYWKTWTECATFSQCLDTLNGTCPTLKNYQQQFRPRIRVTQPPDTCENGRTMRDVVKMQGRLQVTGPGKIHQMRFTFQDIDESPNADCPSDKPCELIDICGLDLYSYTADN